MLLALSDSMGPPLFGQNQQPPALQPSKCAEVMATAHTLQTRNKADVAETWFPKHKSLFHGVAQKHLEHESSVYAQAHGKTGQSCGTHLENLRWAAKPTKIDLFLGGWVPLLQDISQSGASFCTSSQFRPGSHLEKHQKHRNACLNSHQYTIWG